MSTPGTGTAARLTGEMFIGADRVWGTGGEIRAVDPATGRAHATAVGVATEADVARAARLAREAFESYRATPAAERALFLEAVADQIARIADDLRSCVVSETGLPPERVTGETGRTLHQLRLFAGVLGDGSWRGPRFTSAQPDRVPLPRPDIRLRKVPLGPVAVFGASNFPLAFSVAGGDTASALAAGCPVIVKAHESHPGTSELVAGAVRSAVEQAGLHPGTFSLLHGPGKTVGISLVTREEVRAVGFTGSRTAGLALMNAASSERAVPIPFFGELSSVNPVFVLPHALAARPDDLAEQFVRSLTTGAGQLCTNPGLVFAVEGPGLPEFLSRAAALVRTAGRAPMLNATVSDGYAAGVRRLESHPGVECLAEGGADGGPVLGGAPALFTTEVERFLGDPTLQEEVFGAASLVVRLRRPEEISEVLDRLEPQLSVTIHAESADTAVARSLLPGAEEKAGRVVFNDWPTGVEVCEAMVHGGPFPATTDGRSTSVGTLAIDRFLRPVAYQNCPAALLPEGLVDPG